MAEPDRADVEQLKKLRRASERAQAELRAEDQAGQRPVVIRSGTWLNGQQFSPLAWAVPDLFPEGVTVLAGKPKIGKSWLILAICLAIAAGSEILGVLNGQPPRPVLYLALEDSDRRMKERCAQLGWLKIPALFEYITHASPEQALDVMLSWLHEHDGQRPVVVIDTWAKLSLPARRGETTYERDYRTGGYVKFLTGEYPGSSIMINHHTRKESAPDFIDLVSGTQGVAGSADTIAVLTRDQVAGRLQVKGRDVEDQDLALAGFPVWRLDGSSLAEAASRAQVTASRKNLGDRSVKILDAVSEKGQITTAEVADMLDVSSDVASMHLGKLVDSGKIRKISRGVYAALVPPYGSDGSHGNPITPMGGYKSDTAPSTGYDFGQLWRSAREHP